MMGWLLLLGLLVLVVSLTAWAYRRELGRMAAFLRTRDRASNGRLTTQMPGPGFADLARAINGELDAASAEKRQAAQAQRAFQQDLASLSHDIRTPLAGAKGYIQLALGEPEGPGRDRYLASAVERLDAMEVLLGSLFAYSQARDPEATLDLEPVTMLPVLAEVLAGHCPEFEERGWEPAVAFEDEGACVQADRAALARIFENVVANALRHGASAPAIRQRGGAIAFENAVADPAALDVDRLFERFYRADAARSRPGAGLGLAVVTELCAAMGAQADATLEGDRLSIVLTFRRDPIMDLS